MFQTATTSGDDIVNRTVTATTRGANTTTASVLNIKDTTAKITGLMKQARYEVTVIVCTDTCCQETKPVTLSESASSM